MDNKENDLLLHDNYALDEKIGEGGYGLVYKAKQVSTGQIVAIKMLKLQKEKGDQYLKRQVLRFERETQLCAEMNHPNIVKLLDRGFSAAGEPFAVFEYISGCSLKELIHTSRGLSPVVTKELMGQVLDALACAHSLGIVHRDLKPANIMVTQTGSKQHAKILDFGIGAFTKNEQSHDTRDLTLLNEALGTPTYSAPEQLRGEFPTLKSDLYAWGLILIECLKGRPAIEGGSVAEIFHNQLNALNVPLPPFIAGHPLADLLRRVLDKSHHKRMGDAKSVFEEYVLINFNTIVGDLSDRNAEGELLDDDLTVANFILKKNAFTEKKQMTVLCLKLNLEVTEKIKSDLEILEALQKDQLNLCRNTAIQFGGTIAGSITNHIVVYFGFPEVNDTDARRAGRTALELLSEVRRRSAALYKQHGVKLEIQMGINTGNVTVFDHQLPEGLVANTAFDLMYQAGPGQILASESSRKLLQPFLEFDSLPADSGAHKPVTAFLLKGECEAEALSFLRPWSTGRKMIGRTAELEQVLSQWEFEESPENKVVLLTGQAGIGKSKLSYEVVKDIRKRAGLIKVAQCLPEHQNNALYPFLSMFYDQWGINTSTENNEKTARLKRALTEAGCELERSFPILCSWLAIPVPDEMSISQVSPEEQKKILFDTLVRCFFAIDKGSSFLLLVEDLHWSDPTSEEFIEFISQSGQGKVMILLTARLEYVHHWQRIQPLEITLQPFAVNSIRALIEGVLAGKFISDAALEYMTQKTDGVPLFIEEFTLMLVDQGHLILEEETYQLRETILTESIPTTLRDLLNARLDKLKFSKETAQLAAVIGREFSYDLLVKAALAEETAVQADIEQLLKRDLIYLQRSVRGESYIFRHALIRDAAYDGMLSSQRRETHGRIAEVLAADFPAIVKENPFEIARHLAEAAMYPKAVHYGIRAAKQALDRSLNSEALAYAKQVIEWLGHQEEEVKSKDDELTIYCIQTNALMAKYGWSAKEVKDSVQTAFRLVQNPGESNVSLMNSVSSYWALITYYHVASEREKVKEITQHLIQLAKELNDPTLETSAGILKGIHLYVDGEFDASILILETIMDALNHDADLPSELTIGIDNLSYASSMLGQVLWLNGKKKEGEERADWAIERSRKINHIPSLCLTLMYRSAIHQFEGEKEKTAVLTTEILILAKEYGLAAFSAYAAALNCWAIDDVHSIDQIIAQLDGIGCKLGLTYYQALPAVWEFENGLQDQAMARVERCLELCEENKEYFYKEELLKIKSTFIKSK